MSLLWCFSMWCLNWKPSFFLFMNILLNLTHYKICFHLFKKYFKCLLFARTVLSVKGKMVRKEDKSTISAWLYEVVFKKYNFLNLNTMLLVGESMCLFFLRRKKSEQNLKQCILFSVTQNVGVCSKEAFWSSENISPVLILTSWYIWLQFSA